jgi:hypothetical protein
VAGAVEMFGHVFAGRAIAAQCSAASLARAQMHPPAVGFPAFLACKLNCNFDFLYISYMFTNLVHYTSFKYW